MNIPIIASKDTGNGTNMDMAMLIPKDIPIHSI